MTQKVEQIKVKDMEYRDLIRHYEDYFSMKVQMEVGFENIVPYMIFETKEVLAVENLTDTVIAPFLEVLEQAVFTKGYSDFNLEYLAFLNYFEDSINMDILCNMPAGHNWRPVLQQVDLSEVQLKGAMDVFFTDLTQLDKETVRTGCFLPILDTTFSQENYNNAKELNPSLQPDDLVLKSQKFKAEN